MSQTATANQMPAGEAPKSPPGSDENQSRTVHVPVPAWVYWHVRAMALQSRLPFKVYMGRFLAEARAYPPESSGTPRVVDQPARCDQEERR